MSTSEQFGIIYRPVSTRDSQDSDSSSSKSTSISDLLDKLSIKSLVALLIICAVIFSCLIFIIIFAINNPICNPFEEIKHIENQKEDADIEMVDMNGLFQLLDTENYANYLRALEIPIVAAKKIENLRTENITIEENGTSWTTITTITPWLKKSITFKFDEKFNVSYGDGETKGVFQYLCSKPKTNIINCNSFEPERELHVMFDYVFTKNYLVKKSYLISKNIGMTKKYRRLGDT